MQCNTNRLFQSGILQGTQEMLYNTIIHTFTFFLISFLPLLRQEESLLYRDHQPDNKEIRSISVPFPIINEM